MGAVRRLKTQNDEVYGSVRVSLTVFVLPLTDRYSVTTRELYGWLVCAYFKHKQVGFEQILRILA